VVIPKVVAVTYGSGRLRKLFITKVVVTRTSLLAEALFLLFADGRKETSAMGRKWL